MVSGNQRVTVGTHGVTSLVVDNAMKQGAEDQVCNFQRLPSDPLPPNMLHFPKYPKPYKITILQDQELENKHPIQHSGTMSHPSRALVLELLGQEMKKAYIDFAKSGSGRLGSLTSKLQHLRSLLCLLFIVGQGDGILHSPEQGGEVYGPQVNKQAGLANLCKSRLWRDGSS